MWVVKPKIFTAHQCLREPQMIFWEVGPPICTPSPGSVLSIKSQIFPTRPEVLSFASVVPFALLDLRMTGILLKLSSPYHSLLVLAVQELVLLVSAVCEPGSVGLDAGAVLDQLVRAEAHLLRGDLGRVHLVNAHQHL